jgi:hypothetical protein
MAMPIESKISTKMPLFSCVKYPHIIPLCAQDSRLELHKNPSIYWKLFVQFFSRRKPLPKAAAFSLGDLERREVEKRIYGGERQRLTASAAFHGYRIPAVFEQRLTDILIKSDEIVNKMGKTLRNRLLG